MTNQLTKDDLLALLVDLTGIDDNRAEEIGRDFYKKELLTSDCVGLHDLHDGEKVLVHISRFDHAFFTTPRVYGQAERKIVLDRPRIARVRWIKLLISGQLDNSACWEVAARSGRPAFPNRLYVLYEPAYVVWLEPRGQDDSAVCWKFSSGYPANPKYLRDKTKGGTCIWKSAKKSVP